MLESRNLLSTKVMLGFVGKKPVSATRMTPKGHLDRGYLNNTIIR
uniref:Uncharacterized protein n=1 Tax=Wolbachia endosymbiont of Aleurodicus dispersus TaxID=1288877 RepID=A0A3B0IV15_9RICK